MNAQKNVQEKKDMKINLPNLSSYLAPVPYVVNFYYQIPGSLRSTPKPYPSRLGCECVRMFLLVLSPKLNSRHTQTGTHFTWGKSNYGYCGYYSYWGKNVC